MSVAVVTLRRAQPGQGDAVVDLTRRHLAAGGAWQAPRHRLRLFQAVDRPDVLLYVADWDSREAFVASVSEGQIDQQLGALCVGPPERYFFRPRLTFLTRGRVAAVVDCLLIQAPPEAIETIRLRVLREAPREVLAHPGFVLREAYESDSNDGNFGVIHGWESAAAQEAYFGELKPSLDAPALKLGVTILSFTGVARAEASRDSPP